MTRQVAGAEVAPPVLADACLRRRLDPLPFLLALACSANIGSALTLIGNPQNMLIGETLKLSFSGYVREAVAPVLAGLVLTWGILVFQVRGHWKQEGAEAHALPERREGEALDRWQTAKGLAFAVALLLLFLFSSWPREVAALVGAGLLLLSRRLHSSRMLGLVDWELLILFIGLFVVNHAIQETGLTARAVAGLAEAGVRVQEPATLFAATFVLSNIVSNVPAVMLLLPVATDPLAGPMLALVSTLAGAPADRGQHRRHHRRGRRRPPRQPHYPAAPRPGRIAGDPGGHCRLAMAALIPKRQRHKKCGRRSGAT